jgi:hypothetical protein
MPKKAKEKVSMKKSEMRAIFNDMTQRVVDSEEWGSLIDFLHECCVHAAVLLAGLSRDTERDELSEIFVNCFRDHVAIFGAEKNCQQSERAAREGRLQ